MPDSSSIFISGGSLSKDNRKVNVDVNDHILLIICKVSRLVLEVEGTSTLQAAVPVKLKSPPLESSKLGGTSALQAWLPA